MKTSIVLILLTLAACGGGGSSSNIQPEGSEVADGDLTLIGVFENGPSYEFGVDDCDLGLSNETLTLYADENDLYFEAINLKNEIYVSGNYNPDNNSIYYPVTFSGTDDAGISFEEEGECYFQYNTYQNCSTCPIGEYLTERCSSSHVDCILRWSK